MNTRVLLVVLGLTTIGCKSKSKGTPAAGSGSAVAAGSGSAAATRPRPSQQPQPVMPALELPADPQREAKVALGHALFFDVRLSGHDDRSCYSCHQNEHGNGGKDPLAIGSGDKPLTRHSPVIWNVAYWNKALYWDGRAPSLEANAKGAWGGGNMGAGADTPEHTAAALDAKAAKLVAIAGYKPLFEAAYPGAKVTAEHVTGALAEYMRTLICNDTAYDRFAGGDKAALTDGQQRGLDVFLGKGRCGTCHAPPLFSSAMNVEGGVYFNVGIGTGVDEDKVDIGRMKVTNDPAEWAAFKPPSLRNVSRSAPYFHDGSVASLDEAVKLMASGGIPNKNKSPLITDAQLTDAERTDLVDFLGALACGGKLESPTLP